VSGGTAGVLFLAVMSDVTNILAAIDRGELHAAERLLPLVYDELRPLAAGQMAREKPGQTLDATALVHEAYLRLVGPADERRWENRRHFFAAAAEAMRRILVENARRKKADKYGGARQRVDLADIEASSASRPDVWLLLDDALCCLTREDPAAADIAKLRLYAGLSVDDAARVLNLSRATAFRHWTYARAWLNAMLGEAQESQEP
jgi:RNA polymerase sigma factor (TIGR02999 family)